MVLRASGEADRPPRCNVCKRPVPIQDILIVDGSGSPGGVKFDQTASDMNLCLLGK